jgi:octaprenyl-diphosphate synthase
LSPAGVPSGAGGLLSSAATARAEILPLVADRLEQVEQQFRRELASPVRIVDEIGGFVAAGGGKRIRPTVHLLAAKLCGYDGPHDVLLGTVVEYIHCATLIHDDIIDEARMRRGRPSVNSHWGNDVSVLFGDYMFAKAMEMALAAGSLEVMKKLAEATLRMTEGEMLQTRYLGRLDLTVEEYLELIDKKTAALFACCCELAGLLAGVEPARGEALGRYGAHLGMLFQIVDDLLDFTSDAETLGKPAAKDLREGKATLAVLDLLATGAPGARRLVERVMTASSDDAPEVAELAALLEARGSLERVQERARAHAAAAVRELEQFPRGPARRALAALPELLLVRDH